MEQELIIKTNHDPYVREIYHSLSEVYRTIEATKDETGLWKTFKNTSSLHDTMGQYRTDFFQFETMDSWLETCIKQDTPVYQETVERAESLAKQVDTKINWQTFDNKRVKRYSNIGGSIKRHRLYNGHALKPFVQRKRQRTLTNQGVVSILVPLDASAATPKTHLQNAGIAAYILACALERQNRSCEIYGIATHQNLYTIKKQRYTWFCAIKLKSSKLRSSLFAVSPVLFSDFFRRTIFRLAEKNNKWGIHNGYGYAVTGDQSTWYTIQDFIDDYHLDSESVLLSPHADSWHVRNDETILAWVTETLKAING